MSFDPTNPEPAPKPDQAAPASAACDELVCVHLLVPKSTVQKVGSQAAELGLPVGAMMNAKLLADLQPRLHYALQAANHPSAN